ncbi:hypothetical protein [Tenacibaculum haliotis]|uniref:hypothetical protein n=1 Tax=Tenacibaculum haliotis TaxID=1888914 RepID=UPI0021AF28C2|nr:hypothetical protein [Tenacibaculum haliotis]MCT4699671.1 hypothetical protein [Tenacibaculum haliotis]
MKKSILNLGKALNKTQQKQINGGFDCSQFPFGICFGPVPGCLPCNQMQNYPGASRCALMHTSCDSGEFN